jgi:hypothetical protein
MLNQLRRAFKYPSPEDRRLRAVTTLRDSQAPLQEAAAALLALGEFNDSEAWSLLHSVASNSSAHSFLQQSAAEGLASVLQRVGFQEHLLQDLTAEAAESLVAFVSADDPELGQQVSDALAL